MKSMINEQTLAEIVTKIDGEVSKAQKKLREIAKREKEAGVKFDLRMAVEAEIDTFKAARQFVTVAMDMDKEKED
jgi:hypothetical protein